MRFFPFRGSTSAKLKFKLCNSAILRGQLVIGGVLRNGEVPKAGKETNIREIWDSLEWLSFMAYTSLGLHMCVGRAFCVLSNMSKIRQAPEMASMI